MWCENCDGNTPCAQRTVRITKDGREIIIEYCEVCMMRTETEYLMGPTVRLKKAKSSTKRHL